MVKNDSIKAPKRQKRDEIVEILATKWGLSTRQVRRIRDGESRNEAVFTEYMALLQWFNRGKENLLLGAVNELFEGATAPRIQKHPAA